MICFVLAAREIFVVLTHALVERSAWPVWNCVPVMVMMFVEIRFQHKIHQTVIQNNSVCG